MSSTSERPRVVLGLADVAGEALIAASWAGPFVSLGKQLRGYVEKLDGRQLVVAVSVPRRDYVAALVGSGWMLAASARDLGEPIHVFRSVQRGSFVRGVTDNRIVTGVFTSLEDHRAGPRVIAGGKQLPVDRYRAVVRDCCTDR